MRGDRVCELVIIILVFFFFGKEKGPFGLDTEKRIYYHITTEVCFL